MTPPAHFPQTGLVGDHQIPGLLRDGSPLRLAFQPQVDLRSGRIVSAEALARWRHPELGDVAPATFMPAIRRLGLQRALFERVCAQAIDAARSLDTAGIRIPISVNACALTLADPLSLAFLRAEADRRGVDPSLLRIELTEDSPVENQPALRAALTQLRSWGCAVALDDFGTGHANLDILIGLDIDELKLDRKLIAHVNDNLVALECVRFALALGKRMDWRVIAEGISTEAELLTLRALGCDHGQGYLLGRPMPLAQLISFVDAESKHAAPAPSTHAWQPHPATTRGPRHSLASMR
ncbi:EAL domain-containing protein [Achromobacter sp. NPDC058515]|uniref:EAL domain-containing protein n=1 Tax=Achromobacter sp. NPDC058515 TaxID=3346533 RepID=UPI0036698620